MSTTVEALLTFGDIAAVVGSLFALSYIGVRRWM